MTTIDGCNGEASEEKVNSENLNSNNGRSSSNSKNYYETKQLKRPVENENKTIVNNVRYDGKNPSEIRESQQQKFGNPMMIASN